MDEKKVTVTETKSHQSKDWRRGEQNKMQIRLKSKEDREWNQHLFSVRHHQAFISAFSYLQTPSMKSSQTKSEQNKDLIITIFTSFYKGRQNFKERDRRRKDGGTERPGRKEKYSEVLISLHTFSHEHKEQNDRFKPFVGFWQRGPVGLQPLLLSLITLSLHPVLSCPCLSIYIFSTFMFLSAFPLHSVWYKAYLILTTYKKITGSQRV